MHCLPCSDCRDDLVSPVGTVMARKVPYPLLQWAQCARDIRGWLARGLHTMNNKEDDNPKNKQARELTNYDPRGTATAGYQ